MTLDPVTLAVIQNGLRQVASEMDLVHEKTSFSPVISEGFDRSNGIYHRDNRRGHRPGRAGPADLRRRHAVHHPGGDRAPPRPRAGRRHHGQRPLSRRHPSDGREDGEAVLLPRPAVVLPVQHRPLAGYRRHGAGRLRHQGDGDPAGGPAHAAGQARTAAARSCQDIVDIDPEQHPRAGGADRRHQGPGRRAYASASAA